MTTQAAQVGRNSPCPCGSGQRYKDCHGRLGAVGQDAQALHRLGLADMERGDLAAAAANFGRAIALDATRTALHTDLARALFGSGAVAESAASARRAIDLDAANVDAWNVLGLALEATDPAAALAAWEQAIALAPDAPEAHFRVGDFHRRRRDFDAALAAYRAGLALAPDHAVVHNNVALALQEQGLLADAERHFRTAIELQPGMIAPLANLGDLCQRTDRFAEAIAFFGQALAQDPDHAGLWTALGICHDRRGATADARASFERARALNPDDPETLVNLASTFLAEHRYAKALPLLQQALSLQPDLATAQDMLLYLDQQTCRWDDFERLFAQQRARLHQPDAPAVAPHNLLALPYAPAELLTASRKWVAQHIRPQPASPPALTQRIDGRLRIAYLGSDFRTHPLASLLPEVIEKHDRSRFEVIGYSFGPDDHSPERARFARAFDRFVDVREESAAATAQRIRGDRIAILFDTGGFVHLARSEIFALRPAPIQVNCIGFPGTLGADFYDWIVTDGFVTPPGQEIHFAERFLLMPHCYLPGDTQRAIAQPPTRAQCGLPEHGFVFCCFNASYKIGPAVFDVWMRLLREVQGSVLWLLEGNATIRENLRREAQRRDVAPERLVFAPRVPLPEHLARHALADLFLDTAPCNAHTTANDALFAGLPLLCCAGETFASRVSGSHLRAIGLPELITGNLDDYAARALALARDPALLASYRSRLRANRDRSPLFDTAAYARALEHRLCVAWEDWVARSTAGIATPAPD